MASIMRLKYCEDLLLKWDKRIQFEATLLFFFSVVSGSSFVSIHMFSQLNMILNFIPMLYVLAMFCWWYLCKRLVFDTNEPNQRMAIANIISFFIWIIISAAVSLGTWDEWGWIKKDIDVPASDNFYRAMNCLLVAFYIGTLTVDYYTKIDDRSVRVKIWTACLWLHAVVSFSYFVEWVIDAHISHNYESIAARWMAAIGSFLLVLWGIPVMFQSKLYTFQLIILFISLILYWWGSASLDCEFYADTADMTVMVGYQMLWTIALLIVLETLPSMSTEIHVLGTELLMDQEVDPNQNMDTVVPQETIEVETAETVQESHDI